ncbi:hypothetical protein ONS96_005830 [Cadophora gregata f. sp. sojae]|nr:hypothetical protein ONS96_005830 [Cadophora gregata f. sp. sojae]
MRNIHGKKNGPEEIAIQSSSVTGTSSLQRNTGPSHEEDGVKLKGQSFAMPTTKRDKDTSAEVEEGILIKMENWAV